MSQITTSVLIVSFRRPDKLIHCLESLAEQTHPADEVFVVWQGDDYPTRDAVAAVASKAKVTLLHSPETGVVPAENVALDAAKGEIVLLCDDDVIAPPDWIARHVAFYVDPTIGAVGGAAINHQPDGSLSPKRDKEPIGCVKWYGRLIGNMYDHIADWRRRPPMDVDHLVGYNLSLRRSAFDRFESDLKPYWQMFELDACLQVKAGGYRVVFDFANVVDHYPTNTAYVVGRDGNLEIKIFNSSYNEAFVLSKHSWGIQRLVRFFYLIAVGSVSAPGLLASLVAVRRFGNVRREAWIWWKALGAKLAGWLAGRRHRKRGLRT